MTIELKLGHIKIHRTTTLKNADIELSALTEHYFTP